MHRTSWSAGLSATGDGVGVIAHTGSIALRMVAERTGLVKQLSKAMVRRSFVPVHDRGQVVADVAVMLADGGEAISDINVLRHQTQVLGPVASAPTVWRTLDEITAARLGKIQIARARTRRHVWSLLEAAGGVPASKVSDTDLGKMIVLDVDATIVVCHSEKEQASPTFKRTFGYHPIGVWCDNTEEFLASKLCTGRAGSNTAADHIEVLGDAIRQVPAAHRKHVLVRSDGAGSSHCLGRFPSREFAINQAWLALTMIAADLGVWLKLLALKDSVLAKAEPKALRYRMLHVPARLVRGARKRRLQLPKTWPWVDDIVAAFARIAAIPLPA